MNIPEWQSSQLRTQNIEPTEGISVGNRSISVPLDMVARDSGGSQD